MAKKKLFKRLTAVLDAQNLKDLQDRRPDVVVIIRELVADGATVVEVGKAIRADNPQMWLESKYAESVARQILKEQTE